MNKELSDILDSIEADPKDTDEFGKAVIFIIKKSEALHNPEGNYAYLQKFLRDKVDFLDSEIEFTEKYTPEIFHSNVSLSRKFEKEICKKILETLDT